MSEAVREAADESMSLVSAKRALRKRMNALLRGMDAAAVASASARACEHVVASPHFARAHAISIFLSMPGEFDTAPLLRAAEDAGKTVFVPRVTGPGRADMQMVCLHSVADIDGPGFVRSKWGIPEPTDAYAARSGPSTVVDLVLVPGLAFDAAMRRLGRGKGYYDTFIAALRADRARARLDPPFLLVRRTPSIPAHTRSPWGERCSQAVALDDQFLGADQAVPAGEHDQPVHAVALPSGIRAAQ